MNTAKIILGALLLVFSISFAVDVSTCGVIDTPGTYNVLNDLTTATGDCIVINADDVNLNGNGHSISATETDSDGHPIRYAVYVTEGSDNVHVDRCTLENSMVGLRAGDIGSITNGLTLTYIVARSNGWGFELIDLNGALIEHNTAYENAEYGFYMTESTGNTLQYNNEWLSRYGGFYLGSSSNNRLVGNTARQNGYSMTEGIGFSVAFDSDNNVFDSNIASENRVVGFRLTGTGDYVPDGNVFSGNTANDNEFAGMQLIFTGTGNRIYGSTISNNWNGGILATQSPGVEVGSNILTNNGHLAPTNSGIMLYLCDGYIASDNEVDGSPNGIKILNSGMGTLDNTVISDSAYPLLVQDSTGNQITAITVKDSGPVLLRGDATDNSITILTMRDPTGEVIVDIPIYNGDYEVSIATAPAAAPDGYTALNRYVSVLNEGTGGNMQLVIQYQDSDYGTLDESTVTAMLWGGSWSVPAQELHMGSNGVLMNSPGFGIFGLFAGVPPEEPPVEPPVTPPSGGGSTGGGSSGGTTHAGSGGAVHIGVPYVSSGSTGFGGEATTPSCSSDDDCASSATCSGGICTAVEAGSSCGTFEDHEWVDFECCDTSDCGAGEVCKDNACTSMEPLNITPGEGINTEASDEGIGRLLADIPWWVLTLLLLMVGGGIYARYAMGREQPPEGEEGEEEMPPAGEEEE
ncbi:MAG: right-handed parallel beta-helix repeat-containing protein [Candidatus ainarchaeum sp.]|nr:right-handed parallel beta-helix repeat-containing protein [Candidatus ainarchaeum sp.]MDD5095895.1 right-handed parallel beta-helix repeat-containing protein [Candidatus ainarchaeum sp.]